MLDQAIAQNKAVINSDSFKLQNAWKLLCRSVAANSTNKLTELIAGSGQLFDNLKSENQKLKKIKNQLPKGEIQAKEALAQMKFANQESVAQVAEKVKALVNKAEAGAKIAKFARNASIGKAGSLIVSLFLWLLLRINTTFRYIRIFNYPLLR